MPRVVEIALRALPRIFAVDACVFAILSNHFHLLLRNRVDLAAQWSDEEVVRRWWQLCPERRDEQGQPAEPTEMEIASLLHDPKRVVELRRRLSSISTFMQYLNQWIATRANAEASHRPSCRKACHACRNFLCSTNTTPNGPASGGFGYTRGVGATSP